MDKHLVLTIKFEDPEGKPIENFNFPYKVHLPYMGNANPETSVALYSTYIIENLAKRFPEISVEDKKEE